MAADAGSRSPSGDAKLFVHGMGHFHPENIIDNAFLESLDIGTSDQWIMERVGIKRRHTVLPLGYIRETRNRNPVEAPDVSILSDAQLGAGAAKMALSRAGIGPGDVGMVIASSSSPQYLQPTVACTVAAQLGISCLSFDLYSVCASFIVQLHQLLAMRPEALPDYVLLLNVESITRILDYNDRRTAVLLGDAASAAVISARHPAPLEVCFSTANSDPSGWDKGYVPTGRHFFQEGSAIQAYGIRKTCETIEVLRNQVQGDPADMYFIGHQANLTMLTSICERAQVKPDRHLYNIDEYGNCGAAGSPSVLSMNWERFKPGDEIGMAIIGLGLTWGGALLRVGG
jgi:3-oxoacyl-[acyl-carrier-protein] synthase III